MILAVTTFFWSDPDRNRNYKFTHEHVRILRRMVDRNLTIPHKFVCVTDDDINGIDCVPLDWSKHVPNTVYLRLMMRRPDFGELIGADRVFNLDLDLVVTGGLDSLVCRTEPSVFWHNPNFPGPGRAFYQSSVQLFTPGSHSELWSKFDPETQLLPSGEHANWRFGGKEQAWISEMLPWNLPYWDHRDGIYGAGRMLSDQGVRTSLPDNAKIVSFPGNRIPDQPEVIEKHEWITEHYH